MTNKLDDAELAIPSSMSFYSNPSTNVALPLFTPGNNKPQVVGFQDDEMIIVTYMDDTKTPPTSLTPRVLKQWYVCDTIYTSRVYQTLNWRMGRGDPQNPSCVKVAVKREFVK